MRSKSLLSRGFIINTTNSIYALRTMVLLPIMFQTIAFCTIFPEKRKKCLPSKLMFPLLYWITIELRALIPLKLYFCYLLSFLSSLNNIKQTMVCKHTESACSTFYDNGSILITTSDYNEISLQIFIKC